MDRPRSRPQATVDPAHGRSPRSSGVTLMAHYMFFSHDGYGLGHVRRNCVIAEAVRRAEPSAFVTLVTGIPSRPAWLERWQPNVVRVPPLLKDRDGRYRPLDMSFEEAIAQRATIFAQTV